MFVTTQNIMKRPVFVLLRHIDICEICGSSSSGVQDAKLLRCYAVPLGL